MQIWWLLAQSPTENTVASSAGIYTMSLPGQKLIDRARKLLKSCWTECIRLKHLLCQRRSGSVPNVTAAWMVMRSLILEIHEQRNKTICIKWLICNPTYTPLQRLVAFGNCQKKRHNLAESLKCVKNVGFLGTSQPTALQNSGLIHFYFLHFKYLTWFTHSVISCDLRPAQKQKLTQLVWVEK